jgi:hypothetical protein
MLLKAPLIAAAAFAVTLVACAGTPKPDLVIHESARGLVALERMPDTSIQAAHPVKFDPAVIAATLRGLYLKESKTAMDALFSSDPRSSRIFSDDDAAFLAPLIADALATTRADQLVRFTTVQSGALNVTNERVGAAAGSSDSILGSRAERTSGTLYVYGLSLYVSITEFRHRPERPDTVNMPNRRLPDPSGLGNRDLVFVPASAVRSQNSQKGGLFGSDTPVLAIDYQQLPKRTPFAETPASAPQPAAGAEPKPLPPTAATPSQQAAPAASNEELQAVKELVIKKDMEVEALKKDVEELKKELKKRNKKQER